jgi:hypothetical protein
MWILDLLLWLFRKLEEAEKRGSAQRAAVALELEGAVPRQVQAGQPPRSAVPEHRPTPRASETLWPEDGLSPRMRQAQRSLQAAVDHGRGQPQKRTLPTVHARRAPPRRVHHHTPNVVDDAPGGPIDWFLRLLEGVRR